MVKKRVPEWLNSSLWSSSTSNEDDHRLSVAVQPPPSSTTTTTITTTSQQSNNNNHNHIHTSKEAEVVVEAEAEAEAEIETHAPVGPSAEDISRQAQLLSEISKKVVNMRELRRIASQGIPDTAGIRSTVWKLLLGYLPLDRSLWPSEMAKKRSQYKQFKDELLMNPVYLHDSVILELFFPSSLQYLDRQERVSWEVCSCLAEQLMHRQKSQGGWINSKVVRKKTQNVKAGACSQDQK
uniref:Ypt/Rab-GAP domain of gyp1p superfamily protein n=1 Tax=Quercus lobata TaxID=97700 RepID=A0A7N2LY92_QUELO